MASCRALQAELNDVCAACGMPYRHERGAQSARFCCACARAVDRARVGGRVPCRCGYMTVATQPYCPHCPPPRTADGVPRDRIPIVLLSPERDTDGRERELVVWHDPFRRTVYDGEASDGRPLCRWKLLSLVELALLLVVPLNGLVLRAATVRLWGLGRLTHARPAGVPTWVVGPEERPRAPRYPVAVAPQYRGPRSALALQRARKQAQTRG